MADDRHFENSIISISQPRIARFRSNLVGDWSLSAVTHAPFRASVLACFTSWPNAQGRRDGEVS